MKVLNNVLWVLVWVFMASACYEDKGNYDYRDLDEIIIDTAGAGLFGCTAGNACNSSESILQWETGERFRKRLSGIGIQMGSHTARNDDSYSFQRYAFN